MSKQEIEISEELYELTGQAFDLAFFGLKGDDETPLIPVGLYEPEEGRGSFFHFAGSSTAEAVQMARDMATSTSAGYVRYAIAFEVTMKGDEGPFDAVLVEAGEKGDATALVFGQAYGREEETSGTRTVKRNGKMFFVKQAPLAWR